MVYALAQIGRGDDAHGLFDLINPISHALTPAAADRYCVEPYVVAADVYGHGDKAGRGGWTWYTGSAGWLYRAAVEGILGIVPDGGTHLRITPALPSGWPGYSATLRLHGQVHGISVTRQKDGLLVLLDGRAADADGRFSLQGQQSGP
jgi:cyclic beta-1,2-glucan synthetase